MASNLFSSAFLGAAFAETQGTASAATFTTCLDLTSRSDSVARCTSRRRSQSKSQSNFILRLWSWHKTSKSFRKVETRKRKVIEKQDRHGKTQTHIQDSCETTVAPNSIHANVQSMSIPFTKERSLHLVQGNGLSLTYWCATRQKSLLDISPIS